MEDLLMQHVLVEDFLVQQMLEEDDLLMQQEVVMLNNLLIQQLVLMKLLKQQHVGQTEDQPGVFVLVGNHGFYWLDHWTLAPWIPALMTRKGAMVVSSFWSSKLERKVKPSFSVVAFYFKTGLVAR